MKPNDVTLSEMRAIIGHFHQLKMSEWNLHNSLRGHLSQSVAIDLISHGNKKRLALIEQIEKLTMEAVKREINAEDQSRIMSQVSVAIVNYYDYLEFAQADGQFQKGSRARKNEGGNQ